MQNKLLKKALEYLDLGLSIIPVGKDKKPLLVWQQFQTRLPTKTEVKGWWSRWPEANIALITGKISGVVALDIDKKHNRTSSEFQLPPTPCAMSGNGGEHFFFKHKVGDVNIKTGSAIVGDGVDFRGDGGYILLAPSVNDTGGEYIWTIPLESKEDLADIPEWLLKLTTDKGNAKKWLSGINGVSEGSRNDTATSMAGKILSSTAPELWESIGWEQLMIWNNKNTPPLAEKELRGIWESIKKKEGNKDDISTEDSLDIMLSNISIDISPIKRLEHLKPILSKLLDIETIQAEMFIMENIRKYFKMNKEDAKSLIKYFKKLKLSSISKAKLEKEENDKISLIVDRDINFQEVLDVVSKIGIVSEETLKIITAIVLSSYTRPNPPLWLFLIGVPSSFKTELVGLFGGMESIFSLDTLTENAFVSGYIPVDGSETQDLLPLLDNKCFVIKDLNTLFSMNEEMVKKVLGDLTSIFDGKFQKFTATRGMIEYNSLFSMIGCITPSILIKHFNYTSQLGPRFFFLRLPEITEEELKSSFDKYWGDQDRKKNLSYAKLVVSSYCSQLSKKIKDFKLKPETTDIQYMVNNIALFICKARGIAITSKSSFKNDQGKDVTFYEIKDWQVEQPWRILNQLRELLRIITFINGNDSITEKEIKVVKPIVLSTMPVDRAEIIGILSKQCGVSAKEIAHYVNKSTKTIQRTLKELSALGMIDCYKRSESNLSGQSPWLYFIEPVFAKVINAPIPSAEFLSQSKRTLNEAYEALGELDDIDEDGIPSNPNIKTINVEKEDISF